MHVSVACQRPDLTVSVRSWNRKHNFSALVETETGFSALVETEIQFSALVETKTRFCFLMETETCFSVRLLLHFHFPGVRLTSADRARGGGGGWAAVAGEMPYQRPRVRLPRWAGCAAVEMH